MIRYWTLALVTTAACYQMAPSPQYAWMSKPDEQQSTVDTERKPNEQEIDRVFIMTVPHEEPRVAASATRDIEPDEDTLEEEVREAIDAAPGLNNPQAVTLLAVGTVEARDTTEEEQGQSLQDLATTQRIREAVVANDQASFWARNVEIITRDGKVSLIGQVQSDEQRRLIERIARRNAGTVAVDNRLSVVER